MPCRVFSLDILWRTPCTGKESAPCEIGRGIQRLFKQTAAAFRSRNGSAPQKGIFIQTRQGFTRRGFKNQNPARGRKLLHNLLQGLLCNHLRTRTPQGDGNPEGSSLPSLQAYLRTRTPQGDGNRRRRSRKARESIAFKNQNPARGRKHSHSSRLLSIRADLRTRTPQGDGNINRVRAEIDEVNLRTRTPQGDGNFCATLVTTHLQTTFKNQNPARGRKQIRPPRSRTLQGKFKNQNPARGRKLIQ